MSTLTVPASLADAQQIAGRLAAVLTDESSDTGREVNMLITFFANRSSASLRHSEDVILDMMRPLGPIGGRICQHLANHADTTMSAAFWSSISTALTR